MNHSIFRNYYCCNSLIVTVIYLLFRQAVQRRRTSATRVCVSTAVSVKIGGTHTFVTVLKAGAARTAIRVGGPIW